MLKTTCKIVRFSCLLPHPLPLPSPCHLQVSRLISCMAQAVLQVAAKQPVCAVFHTTLPPAGRTARLMQAGDCGSSSVTAREQPQGPPPPYLLLQQPVPHELLLPQIDLAVHHGGVGTVQAALLAGG
jgi:hypothetical protein